MKRTDKKKIIIYALSFLIPFIMVQAFFALCGIYPFGESSILTGDMDVEFVNFYAYFINIFKTKNDMSYMLAKTLGGDFPGLAAFQLHDPLLFLLFFFPGDRIALGIELVFAVQLSIAGLSASVLLNERCGRTWMSLLFSTAYSFMAFFFGYLVLTIYFGCIAILPLAVFFFLKFLDEKKGFAPFVIIAAIYIYINYHMGFMLVIFMIMFYVSRLISDPAYISKLGRFFYSGVTVLMIDGFFLIRTGLSLIGEKTTDTANYGFFRNFCMNQVFANLFSGSTRNQNMPLMYCSIAALFFALIYFMSGTYSIREKLSNLFLLSVLFVSMWINTFDAVWHGFNNPEEFYFRYAYYVSFVVVVLGYKGYVAFTGNEASGKGRLYKVAAVTGIIIAYMAWLTFTGNVYLDRERLTVNIAIVCIITLSALALIIGKRLRVAGLILLIAVSVPDMLYDAKVTYITMNADDDELPPMSRFKEDYQRIGEAVGYVKGSDGGFYRLEKDFDRAVNDPAMFDYIGLSHDSSCEKDSVNHYLTNYGFRETIYYTFYNGGSTSFADAFLGVKYLISAHEHIDKPYDYLSDSGGYTVFRDQYALPMAYVAPAGLTDHVFDGSNTFEKQNMLAAYWDKGMQPIYNRAESEYSLIGAEEPEDGHFVRTDDEGYIVYDVHITENKPLYLYFAAPHMQSGEVFVNGDSLGWYFTENRWNVLCAGRFDVGDTVEIRMQILKDDLDISEACFYYEDDEALKAWADRASELDVGVSEVEEISSSHLKFTVDGDKAKDVVISIPYDSAWRIKCDGEMIKPEPAVELLLGMSIPAGRHEVEMKYVPHGTFAGTVVSLAGIALFVAGIVSERKLKWEPKE